MVLRMHLRQQAVNAIFPTRSFRRFEKKIGTPHTTHHGVWCGDLGSNFKFVVGHTFGDMPSPDARTDAHETPDPYIPNGLTGTVTDNFFSTSWLVAHQISACAKNKKIKTNLLFTLVFLRETVCCRFPLRRSGEKSARLKKRNRHSSANPVDTATHCAQTCTGEQGAVPGQIRCSAPPP